MGIRLVLAVVAAFALPGIAQAKGKNAGKKRKKKIEQAIYAGEMPEGNAHTLRKGQGQVDLFTRSHWGLTNDLQLDVTIGRFLVIGPNLGLEYAFLQNKKQAFSLQARGQTNWMRFSQRATLMPMYTWGGHRSDRVTAGLGIEFAKWDWSRIPQDRAQQFGVAGRTDVDQSVGVPLHIGYDLVQNNKNVFQFWGETDVAAPARDDPFRFQVGTNWTHGWETFRMSLGLTVNYNALADAQEVFDTLEDTIPAFDRELPAFLPLPYVRLWWRF